MPDDFNPTEWITTAEAAELTGYSDFHIRRLARKDKIKGRKFGRDWMINRESILAYEKRMKELGASKHDPWSTGARQKEPEG